MKAFKNMAEKVDRFKIFIGYPEGLEKEREIIKDETKAFSDDLKLRNPRFCFEAVDWDSLHIPFSPCNQTSINNHIRKCDFYLLLLEDHLGSPSKNNGVHGILTRCEEEYEIAKACVFDKKEPMLDLTVFFKKIRNHRINNPGAQLEKILKFKSRIESEENVIHKSFGSESELRELYRNRLNCWETLINKSNEQKGINFEPFSESLPITHQLLPQSDFSHTLS